MFFTFFFFSDVPRETFLLEQPDSSNSIASLRAYPPHHLIFGYHFIVDGDDNNRFGSDRLSSKSGSAAK